MRASHPAALRLLPAALAALALAGCTVGSPSSASPSAPTSPTSPATAGPDGPGATPAEPTTVDWTDPALAVPLDGGWTLRDCEGDAPMLCVHDGDTLLGIVEAMRSPLGSELEDLLDTDGVEAALRSYVADYHATFAADRAAGCAEGYAYEEHDTELVSLAGGTALRYGFSGTDADGVEVERNVSYVAIVDGELQLVTVLANTPASCVYSDEMVELTPEELRRIEPQLDALAAGSILPR